MKKKEKVYEVETNGMPDLNQVSDELLKLFCNDILDGLNAFLKDSSQKSIE